MLGRKRSPKREDVLKTLDGVRGPDGRGLVAGGLVESASIDDQGQVLVTLAVSPALAGSAEAWRATAQEALSRLRGVTRARVVLTAHDVSAAPAPGQTRVRKGARLSQAALEQSSGDGRAAVPGIPGIGAILAVASAKGGVGKSTVAANLACAFAGLGLRTGLLDIDIYGPSIPTLMGTRDREPESDGKLVPVTAHGVKTMSIGYMVDADAPMIWRGPIVTSAIRQMLNDVRWGDLDILVMDTPPGTGDAQLALAQSVPLSAALIVSTPQEVALADVRRGAAMFAKTHVPVAGVVENMAWLDLPDGSRLHPFGEGGARRTAEALGLRFLAALALDPAVRESGDAGVPVTVSDPGGASARAFVDLAVATLEAMRGQSLKPAPAIRFVD